MSAPIVATRASATGHRRPPERSRRLYARDHECRSETRGTHALANRQKDVYRRLPSPLARGVRAHDCDRRAGPGGVIACVANQQPDAPRKQQARRPTSASRGLALRIIRAMQPSGMRGKTAEFVS